MCREMKDSGYLWIGYIPSDWNVSKVKRVFSIGRGRVIATTELVDSGYPVYSSQTKNNGILGYIDTYDFDRSQLTWTTDGANAGTVFLREGKHNCTNVCGTLMPKNEENDLRYLHYALSYIAFYHKRADINGYKIMNNEMAEIEIILPPLWEQTCIADYLNAECSRIDVVIEKTRASIEEYKKLKQSVIMQAVTKGIHSDRPMKETGKLWIGEIPAHWDLMRIKNIILPSKEGIKIGPFGSALTNKTQENGDYNVYSQANLISDDFSSTKNTIDAETFVELQGYEVFPDDICLSMMGTIGKCKKVPPDIRRGIMDSHLIKLRLAACIDSRFFEYTYDKDLGGVCFQQMQYDKKGFIMDGLNTSIVKNLYFPVPPFEEQIEIVEYLNIKCKEMDRLIQNKLQFLSELEAYKRALIFEYVTGKKKVPA